MDPTQAVLDEVLDRAATARVLADGEADGQPLSDVVLLEIAEDSALAELRDALRIHDRPSGHCMCFGDTTVELLDRRGQRLAVIGVHHGERLRWTRWDADAELRDGRKLLQWMATRGAPGPLSSFEADELRRAANIAAYERYIQAVPDCVRPFWEGLVEAPSPHEATMAQVSQVLAEACPDEGQRGLLLLAWYGHGAGSWNPHASYEGIPEMLLLPMPTRVLVEALEGAIAGGTITDEQLTGAARYFCCWNFNRKKKKANASRLTEPLKCKLLQHVLQHVPADNHDAARRRLG